MQYEISTDKPNGITWNSKGNNRILQNVINLINTNLYEIAYARTIGINPDWMHKPCQQSAAIMANNIITLINNREPRAKIKSVALAGVNSKGEMVLKVVIEI